MQLLAEHVLDAQQRIARIGIEPQYTEKVFGIFRCLQPRDKSSGSGMGLAICRKIVTRHEGRIWVESALGKGTTVYFTLPDTVPNSPPWVPGLNPAI